MNTSNFEDADPGPPSTVDRDPASDVKETIASYDQVAAEFAARWGGLRLTRALDAFAGRVSGRRRVLDLGCGPGRDLDFLAERGCQVVGLDRSLSMLRQARCRLPGVPLALADLRHAPFTPGCFDGVWACASLLHLRRAELPAALRDVYRLLHHPGGVFYLALKGGQGERWTVQEGGRRVFFAYYDPAEIRTALGCAGFQVVEFWVEPDHQQGRHEPWINATAVVGRA